MAIDFGYTLGYAGGDASPDLRASTGIQVVYDAARKRSETDEGSWPMDRGYGFNLRNLVLENVPDPQWVRDRWAQEVLKIEQVNSVEVTVRWNPKVRELALHTRGISGLGPFAFTVNVSQVSAEFLQLDPRIGST